MSARRRLEALERIEAEKGPPLPRDTADFTDEQLEQLEAELEGEAMGPLSRRALVRCGGIKLRGRRIEDVPDDEIEAAWEAIERQLTDGCGRLGSDDE